MVISFVFPGKFESSDERHVERREKINGVAPTRPSVARDEAVVVESEKESDMEKRGDSRSGEPISDPTPDTIVRTGNEVVDFLEARHIEPMDPVEVRKATRLAVGFNILFLTVAILFVPFLLFGGEWVFSKGGFIGWCVVSFIWVWCSMVICVIWPVVESRETIWRIMKGCVRDIGTRGSGKVEDINETTA